MLKGMKSQRQLATFVALAVGGAFVSAPTAQAAESSNDKSTSVEMNDTRLTGDGTAAHPYGNIVGTDLLNGSVTGNHLTIGKLIQPSPGLPYVNGTITAGGKAVTTADVSGNTLTINNINLVGNAYAGEGKASVFNNIVEMNGGSVQGELHGGHAESMVQQTGTDKAIENTVRMSGGTVTGALYGAYSVTGGATHGKVELTNAGGTIYGTVKAGADGIAIAGARGKTSANNNDVVIERGRVEGRIYGGYAENISTNGATAGNRVTVGDVKGGYTPNLTKAELYGGNDTVHYGNNILTVRTKNVDAISAKNFDKYTFALNAGIHAGDTMLTLTEDGNALGRNVSLADFKVDAAGWSGKGVNAQNQDVKGYYGDVGTVTLMKDGKPTTNPTWYDRLSNLRFSNSADQYGVSGDYEYQMSVNSYTTRDYPLIPQHSTAWNEVNATFHRFQNADATYNSSAAVNGAIYGGYSIWEKQNVRDNKLKITNAGGTLLPNGTYQGTLSAYGGKTTTGADAINNQLSMTGGVMANLYGGHAEHEGSVKDNGVVLTGGTVTGEIIGGRSVGGTGTVQSNKVIVENAVVGGGVTGGSGKTTVADNEVTIGGNLITNTVHSVIGGDVVGAYIDGDDSTSRTATGNKVTITEGDIQKIVYGVYGDFWASGSSQDTKTPTVQKNSVTISGGSAKDIRGAYLTRIGTASENEVTVTGTAKLGDKIYGAYTDGTARLEKNSVTIRAGSDAVVNNVYGALSNGAWSDGKGTDGEVTGNKVTIESGDVRDDVVGGESTSSAYNAAVVTKNEVTITDGVVHGDVYGGITHADLPTGNDKLEKSSGGNIVTISGGRIGGLRKDGSTVDSAIYGGYAHGTNKTVETGNTINLGSADGQYSADLTHTTIYGGATTADGNTLNVKAKNITVKAVYNFQNYKFFLTDRVQAGDTMLTLTGQDPSGKLFTGTQSVNFANFGLDLTRMSNRQIAGRVTLIDASKSNGLSFTNYDPQGASAVTQTNGDYEYSLRTDTNEAIGKKVLLDYNRFQNGDVKYEATDATKDQAEWFAGLSYGGQTTKHNRLTIDGTLTRSITAYGAKTLGKTGGSGGTTPNDGNTLEIRSTGTNPFSVTEGYGGYIGRSNNTDTVQNNRVLMAGGTAGTLYGGYSAGTGAVTDNTVQITGGKVTGNVFAGWSAAAGQATKNTLILGADNGSYDATIEGDIYGANDTGAGADNTLIVQAGDSSDNKKQVVVNKVRNFDTFKFILHNNTLIGKTMLHIKGAGGLGTIVNFKKITVDAQKFNIDPTWMGSHSLRLIQSADGMNFSNYSATDITKTYYPNDPYEAYLHINGNASTTTATGTVTGQDVLLTVNRLRDGDRRYDGTDAKLVSDEVFTGISAMGYDVERNKLLITGTQADGIKTFAAAGVTTGEKKANLTSNALTIDRDAALSIRDVYGAYAKNIASDGEMTDNSVTLLNGNLTGNIYGAKSESKLKLSSNRVQVLNGSVVGNIYGGYSVSGDVEKSIVDLGRVTVGRLADNGSMIGGNVYGGWGKTAKDNIVTLRGTTVKGHVYGGWLSTGSPANDGPAPLTDGNTLNIYDTGTTVGYFEGFQNLNFYLSPKSDMRFSMLTLTDLSHKDIRGMTLGIDIDGDGAPIHNGDIVSLVKLPTDKNLTTDDFTGKEYKTQKGVTLNYTFGLETRNTVNASSGYKNELIARVKSVSVSPQAKSLVETQSAALAFLASGSDLIVNVGIPAAEAAAGQIADIVDAPLANSKNTDASKAPLSMLGSYQLFAAQSYGSARLKTGSYVDAKGWNLNVGFARRNELSDSSLTFGPFVEYGRGSYDSYLDDGTHGDGKTSYLGFGVMAKSENMSGTYIEGSLRVGKAKSDYSGTVESRGTGYDTSSNYFAGHLGIGQKREFLSGNQFETYAKYFYAHQAGMSTKLSSGETYDFGASNSSRLRLGTRYTIKNGLDSELYAGLAWEYEFDGKSSASYQGFGLPGTSLKGGTTLFELGYRFAPADSTVTYGLNLTGYAGKRKGITGGFNIAWAF